MLKNKGHSGLGVGAKPGALGEQVRGEVEKGPFVSRENKSKVRKKFSLSEVSFFRKFGCMSFCTVRALKNALSGKILLSLSCLRNVRIISSAVRLMSGVTVKLVEKLPKMELLAIIQGI